MDAALNPEARAARSPELLSRHDSALLVVDMQDKLLAAIQGSHLLVWNARRLIDAAQLLQIPCYATEQYPQKLGRAVDEIAQRIAERPAKQSFSCGEALPYQQWSERGIYKIVIGGIETHVCILQTVLDLLSAGFRVYVVVDATGSRHAIDHEIALRRMEASGATLTTTEAVMFEWCETSNAPEFKQISQWIREKPTL